MMHLTSGLQVTLLSPCFDQPNYTKIAKSYRLHWYRNATILEYVKSTSTSTADRKSSQISTSGRLNTLECNRRGSHSLCQHRQKHQSGTQSSLCQATRAVFKRATCSVKALSNISRFCHPRTLPIDCSDFRGDLTFQV